MIVKHLVYEDGSDLATELVSGALARGERLVAPAWAWSEVGSALRGRVARHQLLAREAESQWRAYLQLPIEFRDGREIRERSWNIAARFDLPTLYDAAFLACVEIVAGPEAAEFWTADRQLLRQLGARRPAYVRELGT